MSHACLLFPRSYEVKSLGLYGKVLSEHSYTIIRATSILACAFWGRFIIVSETCDYICGQPLNKR